MSTIYRLKRDDFSRLSGFRRISGRFFSISYGTLPNRGVPGGACVVSAKAVRNATDRNRVKRRCRALLLPLLKSVGMPIVVVCYAKKGAHTATFEQIATDLQSLFSQAKIQ